MASAELEGRELLVVRQGRHILAGANVRVAPGETVVVEGPSGSGKSTLLRALATMIEPDAGEVLLGGSSSRDIPPRVYRTRVAYVPQQPPMFDGTVADNVRAGPRLRHIELATTEVEELLRRVGLPPAFATDEARSLSGGERQRVALARALANKPEVLLLDEPTSALDPAVGRRVVELIRSLAGNGIAVMVVTHIPEHAAALAGRRFVCEAGMVRPLAVSS
jgi:putative ABC transport system ATP-binding protein